MAIPSQDIDLTCIEREETWKRDDEILPVSGMHPDTVPADCLSPTDWFYYESEVPVLRLPW